MNIHLQRFYGTKFLASENEDGADPELELEVEDPEEEPFEEDPEEEPSEEDPEEELPDPAPKKEGRYQKLANEARAERERAIKAEARAALLEEQSRSAPQRDNGEAARQRAEKLALMDPMERKVFEQEETIRRLEQGQNLSQVQMTDYKDEAKYDAIAATGTPKGKAYAKHKDWIESTLAQERKQGRNPSRELLIRIKLGDDALNAKPSKAVGKEKAAAAARVQAVTTKPTSGRGDVGAGRAKGGEETLAQMEARILERERTGR